MFELMWLWSWLSGGDDEACPSEDPLVLVKTMGMGQKDADMRLLMSRQHATGVHGCHRCDALSKQLQQAQAEYRVIQNKLDSVFRLLPHPGKDIRSYQSEKYRPGWSLLLILFDPKVAKDLDCLASALRDAVEDMRTNIVIDLLFDRRLWYPGVEGGGLHWRWGREDGTRADLGHFNSEGVWIQPADSDNHWQIDYAPARKKIIDAFRAIKEGPAQTLVDCVQCFQNIAYQQILGAKADVTPCDLNVMHPIRPAEYTNRHYVEHLDSEGGRKILTKALHKIQDSLAGREKLLYFDESELILWDKILQRKLQARKINYTNVLFSHLVLINNSFHQDMDSLFSEGSPCEVIHGHFKRFERIVAKMEAEYIDVVRPQTICLKDLLRITCLVDDHQHLEEALALLRSKYDVGVVKDRLDDLTHDVLVVFDYSNGFLAEVQFQFRTVFLLKMFSHSAYQLTRLSPDSPSAVDDILKTLFTIPTWLVNFAGEYETRSPEDIQLRLPF